MSPCKTTWSGDFVTFCKDALIVCNHPANFGGCGHCGSGDITYLICYVTLQDHEIKRSCDFLEISSSLYVTTLPSLEAIHCGNGDIRHLICPVALKKYGIKGPCDFMEGSSLLYVAFLPGLVVIAIVVVEM